MIKQHERKIHKKLSQRSGTLHIRIVAMSYPVIESMASFSKALFVFHSTVEECDKKQKCTHPRRGKIVN